MNEKSVWQNFGSGQRPGGAAALPSGPDDPFLPFFHASVRYDTIPPSIPPPAQSRSVVTTLAPFPCRER